MMDILKKGYFGLFRFNRIERNIIEYLLAEKPNKIGIFQRKAGNSASNLALVMTRILGFLCSGSTLNWSKLLDIKFI